MSDPEAATEAPALADQTTPDDLGDDDFGDFAEFTGAEEPPADDDEFGDFSTVEEPVPAPVAPPPAPIQRQNSVATDPASVAAAARLRLQALLPSAQPLGNVHIATLETLGKRYPTLQQPAVLSEVTASSLNAARLRVFARLVRREILFMLLNSGYFKAKGLCCHFDEHNSTKLYYLCVWMYLQGIDVSQLPSELMSELIVPAAAVSQQQQQHAVPTDYKLPAVTLATEYTQEMDVSVLDQEVAEEESHVQHPQQQQDENKEIIEKQGQPEESPADGPVSVEGKAENLNEEEAVAEVVDVDITESSNSFNEEAVIAIAGEGGLSPTEEEKQQQQQKDLYMTEEVPEELPGFAASESNANNTEPELEQQAQPSEFEFETTEMESSQPISINADPFPPPAPVLKPSTSGGGLAAALDLEEAKEEILYTEHHHIGSLNINSAQFANVDQAPGGLLAALDLEEAREEVLLADQQQHVGQQTVNEFDEEFTDFAVAAPPLPDPDLIAGLNDDPLALAGDEEVRVYVEPPLQLQLPTEMEEVGVESSRDAGEESCVLPPSGDAVNGGTVIIPVSAMHLELPDDGVNEGEEEEEDEDDSFDDFDYPPGVLQPYVEETGVTSLQLQDQDEDEDEEGEEDDFGYFWPYTEDPALDGAHMELEPEERQFAPPITILLSEEEYDAWLGGAGTNASAATADLEPPIDVNGLEEEAAIEAAADVDHRSAVDNDINEEEDEFADFESALPIPAIPTVPDSNGTAEPNGCSNEDKEAGVASENALNMDAAVEELVKKMPDLSVMLSDEIAKF